MTLGHKSPWVRTTKGQFRKLAANRSEPVCVCVGGGLIGPIHLQTSRGTANSVRMGQDPERSRGQPKSHSFKW